MRSNECIPGHNSPPRYTAREVGSLLVLLIGIAIVGSSLVLNPWIARLWQGPFVVDKIDVLWKYFVSSLTLGSATVVLSWALRRSLARRIDKLTVLFVICTAIFLGDRLLLVRSGLPLWTYDSQLHFRHRPGAVRTLKQSRPPGDLIRINSHGFHDEEFDEEKGRRELRGLVIGDSVTMAYGLTYRETFSSHLERLLETNIEFYSSFQIINTGVHGYGTSQEVQVLRDAMRFDPDFIVVGFCMNDVTEPFVVRRGLGGVGFDYHGIREAANPLYGYLVNETGLGRFTLQLKWRARRLEAAKLQEVWDVRQMSQSSRLDPPFDRAWELVLSDLEEMYELAQIHDIPIVLLIFPLSFQLVDDQLRMPQEVLKGHAADQGVEVIDLTDRFSELVFSDTETLTFLRRRGYGAEEIEQFFQWRISTYFLDADHFTDVGHQVIAEAVFNYLSTDLLSSKREPVGPAS